MRQEHRHHTDEQIADAITFAHTLVDDLRISDDLRVAAFQSAVNLRVAKSIVETPLQPLNVPTMTIPRDR